MNGSPAQQIAFGEFLLDHGNARLQRNGQPVPLTPKAFDVLSHLAAHADQLVSKKQLLAAVWPDVFVSDASIKVCVREVRKALEDDADAPRFIETVHRRGYRFVAPVTVTSAHRNGGADILVCPDPTVRTIASPPSSNPSFSTPSPLLVGRDRELEALRESFARAAAGHRQIAFVVGPPGTGKTALVEAFLQELSSATSPPRITIGHCFEQFGAGEPYLPIWESLSRLNEQPLGSDSTFTHHSQDRTTATEPRLPSERLLRELADTLEAAATDLPTVVILEDLHWADYSTLDLIGALARRRAPARLLIVGTYRPGEAPDREQPLRTITQDLRHVCRELKLGPLDESAVARYLGGRLPDRDVADQLPRNLYRRSGGHPLFLASLVDELIERGGDFDADEQISSRVHADIPASIKSVIDTQFDRLAPDEQQVLEAAAVAGIEFSAAAAAAAAAAALGEDPVAVERACDELSRRHRFLQPAGVADWPDGTLANRYRFIHELYHNAVTARTPAARRVQMHRALGNRLEAAWRSRPGEHAAELALHFERGREFARAVHHLRQCAQHATRQYAHREAIDYLRRALTLLDRLPDHERLDAELPLLKSLGVHLQVTQGFSAPEVRAVQARAYELCKHVRDTAQTFPVLWGIWLFHKVRSELREASKLADQLLAIAQDSADPALLLQAYQAISVTSLCLGDPRRCAQQIDLAAAIYDPDRHAGNTQVYGQDPCVATAAFGAVALWLTGQSDQALRTSDRAVALARQLAQPSTLALALHFAAMLHQFRGDADAVDRFARESIELSREEGFSFWLAGGNILQGWAMTATGDDVPAGIARMRTGIDAWLATGSRTYHTYHLGLLADGLLRQGETEEALALILEALQTATDMPEGIYEAELHRLRNRALRDSGTYPGGSFATAARASAKFGSTARAAS
jgi:DNA-binding winged helix-turn-helix (wHTH) protein/predicted ATPase